MIKTLEERLNELGPDDRVLVAGRGLEYFTPAVKAAKELRFWDRKSSPNIGDRIALVVFTTFSEHSTFFGCRARYQDLVFNNVVKPQNLCRALAAWLKTRTKETAVQRQVIEVAPVEAKTAMKVRRGDLKVFVDLHRDRILRMRAEGTTLAAIGESLLRDAQEVGVFTTASSLIKAIGIMCSKNRRNQGEVLVKEAKRIEAKALEIVAPTVAPEATSTDVSEVIKALETLTNSVHLLAEVGTLRKENAELKAKLEALRRALS